MNSQGLCYQPLSQTYLDKQNTHTIYRYVYSMYMYISIFQVEENSSSLQCLHLPFPTQHTFFHAKHLLSSVHGNHPFSQRPPPQRSSIALKTNIFTKVAPQVSAVFQEPHLFFGQERKKQRKQQNKPKHER